MAQAAFPENSVLKLFNNKKRVYDSNCLEKVGGWISKAACCTSMRALGDITIPKALLGSPMKENANSWVSAQISRAFYPNKWLEAFFESKASMLTGTQSQMIANEQLESCIYRFGR